MSPDVWMSQPVRLDQVPPTLFHARNPRNHEALLAVKEPDAVRRTPLFVPPLTRRGRPRSQGSPRTPGTSRSVPARVV